LIATAPRIKRDKSSSKGKGKGKGKGSGILDDIKSTLFGKGEGGDAYAYSRPRQHAADYNNPHGIYYSNIDAHHRTWAKSDPGTTGAYDRTTVEQLIHTEEGKKYFHFFKDMLLGSEEHYYISYLFNNPRTSKFVRSLSAQSVWNTWKFGTWDTGMGGFKTHTHFLLAKNMPVLRGLSKRGVLFARKLSQKKTAEMLDLLDAFIDAEDSPQGRDWPGFLPTAEEAAGEREKEKDS
jgi:hypothetical protein